MDDIGNFNQQAPVLFDEKIDVWFSRRVFAGVEFFNNIKLLRILMSYMLQSQRRNLTKKFNPQIINDGNKSVDCVAQPHRQKNSFFINFYQKRYALRSLCGDVVYFPGIRRKKITGQLISQGKYSLEAYDKSTMDILKNTNFFK